MCMSISVCSLCRLCTWLDLTSFKFHAVSITRRFQYMPFPVSSYLPFPINAVSFTRAFHHYRCYTRIPLHTVSVTRAFSVPCDSSAFLYILSNAAMQCIAQTTSQLASQTQNCITSQVGHYGAEWCLSLFAKVCFCRSYCTQYESFFLAHGVYGE